MLSRDEVVDLYRLFLDRDPESEQIINEKRHAPNVVEVAAEMLMSAEFLTRNQEHFHDVPQMTSAPLRESLHKRIARALIARLLRTSTGKSLKEIARSLNSSGARP